MENILDLLDNRFGYLLIGLILLPLVISFKIYYHFMGETRSDISHLNSLIISLKKELSEQKETIKELEKKSKILDDYLRIGWERQENWKITVKD